MSAVDRVSLAVTAMTIARDVTEPSTSMITRACLYVCVCDTQVYAKVTLEPFTVKQDGRMIVITLSYNEFIMLRSSGSFETISMVGNMKASAEVVDKKS